MQSGTNKLKATVSLVIDDPANPAFVAPNVPMLVTTRQSHHDGPSACHTYPPTHTHTDTQLNFKMCAGWEGSEEPGRS